MRYVTEEVMQSSPTLDLDPFSRVVQVSQFRNPFDETFNVEIEIRVTDESIYTVVAYDLSNDRLFHFTHLHDDWEDALRSWESCRERWEKIVGLS